MKFGLPPWLRHTDGAAGAECEPQAEAAALELVEPTEEEARNGWDAESLTGYLAGRERAQAGVIMFDSKYRRRPRSRRANSKYRPHYWGRRTV